VGCPVFLIVNLVRSLCKNKTKDQFPFAKDPNLRLNVSKEKASDKYSVSKLDQDEPNDDLKKSVKNGDKVTLIGSDLNRTPSEIKCYVDPNLVIDEENGGSPQGQRDPLVQPNHQNIVFYGDKAENFNQENLFSSSSFLVSPPKSLKAKEVNEGNS